MMDYLPLARTRILDLTREAPGRACAHIFGQLGAEVRRGEPYAISDLDRRTWDLVLSDLRPPELDDIGWAPAGGRDGPSVVSITPFGLDGPYATCDDARRASGWLGQRAAAALAAAHAAAVGLAALRASRRCDRGFVAEVATYEVVATCLGDALPPVVCPRRTRPSAGRPRITVARCADGFVGLAAPTPLDRAHLAALTDVPSVATEEADLGALLVDWLSVRPRLQVFHEAQLWRIPIVPVLSEDEVLANEHTAVEGLRRHDAKRSGSPGTPFRFVCPGFLAASAKEDSPSSVEGEGESSAAPPLSDIQVLDLGMVWAGPYCGRLLTSLGADVVKVEGPTRRDGTRAPDGWEGCAGVYEDLNRGKKSLVVDLATDAGRDAFLRVAAAVDVVLDSFSPRVMPNLGLDHAALQRANAAIITLSMPAFRSGGPWGAFVTYGSGLELASGLARRGPDGRPVAAPVPYLDYLSGAYGALAVLAALIARGERSAESFDGGVHIEVAQSDVARQLHAEGLRNLAAKGSPFDPAALARDPHLIARGLLPPVEASDCEHLLRPPWLLHGVPR